MFVSTVTDERMALIDPSSLCSSLRLAALSNDHFEANPDEINWGDVGTLTHYASLLRQITDRAFSEGEHTK